MKISDISEAEVDQVVTRQDYSSDLGLGQFTSAQQATLDVRASSADQMLTAALNKQPISKGGMSHLNKPAAKPTVTVKPPPPVVKPTVAVKPATTTAIKPSPQSSINLETFSTDDIAALYAAAQKGEGYSSFSGSMSAEQVKTLKSAIEAEYTKRKGAIVKADAEVASAGQSSTDAGAKPEAAGYGLAKLLKNPWYWVAVAVVVGGGVLLWMRSRRSVQRVAPVGTVELLGLPAPKRKRRKRKSKKAE